MISQTICFTASHDGGSEEGYAADFDYSELEVELNDEEYLAYRKAIFTRTPFEEVRELKDAKQRAYDQLADEIVEVIHDDDWYPYKEERDAILGYEKVEPQELVGLVRKGDKNALKYLGLSKIPESKRICFEVADLDFDLDDYPCLRDIYPENYEDASSSNLDLLLMTESAYVLFPDLDEEYERFMDDGYEEEDIYELTDSLCKDGNFEGVKKGLGYLLEFAEQYWDNEVVDWVKELTRKVEFRTDMLLFLQGKEAVFSKNFDVFGTSMEFYNLNSSNRLKALSYIRYLALDNNQDGV